jgi:predicted Fe-Mo cluster-binding NifX family protein
MKIAIPTRDNETISRHFGKMTGMIVINLDDGTETDRETRDMTVMPACGAGNHGRPDFVVGVLADCDVVIANGIGVPLADRIRDEGTEVVLTRLRTINEARDAYLDGTIDHEPMLAHPTRR